MTDSRTGIEWQPHAIPGARLRGFRDDPGRIVLLISAVLLFAGAFLPWASGLDPLQKPIAYTAQEGLADGFILMVLALMLAVMAGTRLLVETTSRTVQLLPLGLAVVALAMWIGADRASLAAIKDWETLGGQGDQTLIRTTTALAIGLIVVGVLWLEVTRPQAIKAATHGLRDEWRISRVSLVEGIVAAILAVIFAVAFGVATIAAVGPNGAFFAVFSTLIGMAVGISIGLGLVRWIRGGRDTPTHDDTAQPNKRKVELSRVERKR
jgi:hypothetical protein